MQPVAEYLQQHVEDAPRVLLEHLRQELVEEALHAQGLDLRVHEESGTKNISSSRDRSFPDALPREFLFPDTSSA